MSRDHNDKKQKTKKFLFNINLADTLRLTMLGTLISLTKDITRVPLDLPGHTSIFWMGLLVLGRGLIPKFGAGIIMGVVSGVLAVILGQGKEGVLVFFKYLIPGLVLDFIAPIFKNNLSVPAIGTLCGVITSLSKLVVNVVLAYIMKIPLTFITIGLGISSFSHALFGAIGGFVAALLIKQIKPRLSSWE